MNSLNRIKQLLYKEFKGKGISLLILFPIMMLVTFFAFALDFGVFTMIIGFILPIVYTQWRFIENKNFTEKYLLIPANSGEKIISTLIICTVLFPLMAFLICILTAMCIQPMDGAPISNAFNFDSLLWESFSLKIILLLFLLQSIFITFITKYNKKGTYIVYGIAFLYFGIKIISYLAYRLIEIFRIPHIRALFDFEQQFQGAFYQEISCIANIIMIILTVLFWIAAYFCLREKELE